MEYIVLILGILVLAVSVAGTVLPGLPGPILAMGAIVLALFNPHARSKMVDSNFLWVILLIAITAVVYFLSSKRKGTTIEGTEGRVPGAANIQLVNILLIATYFVILVV